MALVEVAKSQSLAVLVCTGEVVGDLGEAGHGELDITLGMLVDVSEHSLEPVL